AIYPRSGPNGTFFSAVGQGVKARLDEENRHGGIGGRKLTLSVADDGDGDLANERAARRLVDDDHVFGVMEATTASEGGAALMHRRGVPVTGWGITPAW